MWLLFKRTQLDMTKIAFIGAGKMASAIIHGLLRDQHYQPQDIACTCGKDTTGPQLAKATGIIYQPDLTTLLATCETLVLACKPQQIKDLSPVLADLTAAKLVVSILAGIQLCTLNQKFCAARNIVRAMPNTPGQIGAGITGYATQHPLQPTDATTVSNLMSSLGEAIELAEDQLDAVTAISGSGPAYVFEFAAALREAACALDLEPTVAEKLALHTLYGAAKLLATTGDDPDALRDRVTSPGGTTQAALESLASSNFRAVISTAAKAARDRSLELAKL